METVKQLNKQEFTTKVADIEKSKGEWKFLGERPAVIDFFATWCGPCKREMPEVQALYEKYGNNEGDVIVLGVANPKSEEYPYHQDVTQPEVEQFLEDGGYTFPVVMDVTGEVFYSYGISAFPTTFMIGADGNVFGYVPGALTGDMMESIVQQTIDGVEAGA